MNPSLPSRASWKLVRAAAAISALALSATAEVPFACKTPTHPLSYAGYYTHTTAGDFDGDANLDVVYVYRE